MMLTRLGVGREGRRLQIGGRCAEIQALQIIKIVFIVQFFIFKKILKKSQKQDFFDLDLSKKISVIFTCKMRIVVASGRGLLSFQQVFGG